MGASGVKARAAGTGLALLMGLAALTSGVLAARQVGSPSDTSMPESAVVHGARQVLEGKPLYADYGRPPFICAPYMPLYYGAVGGLGRRLGAGPEGLFTLGRWISLAALLLAGGVIAWNEARLAGPRRGIGLAVPAFLASPFVLAWGPTARPDTLGLFFSLAGTLLWLKFEEKPWRYLTVVLCLLAFLTKQSFVAAPGALLLYLAIGKRKADALRVGGLFAGSVIAALLIMHAATDGLSTLNILDANLVPFSMTNLRLIGGRFLQSAAFPLLLALVGLNRERMHSLPFLYFAVSLLWAFYASLKLGSDLNYFLEPMAAACLLIPYTLETMEKEEGSRLNAVLLLAGLLWAVPQINYRVNALETYRVEDESRVRALVREFDGLVLTDAPRLAYLSRSPFLIDPYQLASLQTAGKWEVAPLLQMLDEGQVGLVVLKSPPEAGSTWQGQPRLPKGVAEIIRRRFVRTETLDGFLVYRCRSAHP
jgi:hypothetical protein